MKKVILYFIVSSLVGFGIGYLVFDGLAQKNSQTREPSSTQESVVEENTSTETETNTTPVSIDTAIFTEKGCLGCHSVSGLNLSGGVTGPDLSQAFTNVEGKHGKPVNEFLKEPTSAVMSGVIAGNPLTDDEIANITQLLQQANR